MSTNLLQNKVQASDGNVNDQFGHSVSLSGSFAIVGASRQDSGGPDAGAAYMFQRQGSGWKEVQKLEASDAQANDQFGSSVSLDGNFAIVGAHMNRSGSYYTGAAYLFQRQGSGWKEVQKVEASDAQPNDYFGWSVAVDGQFAIVGAPYEDSGASNAGAAYLFQRQGDGSWKEVQKLQASDAYANDQFGYSVSLDGHLAIVGAHYKSSGRVYYTGAAYLFERQGNGSWKEVQKLEASDAYTNDRFGGSVSLSGNLAIVGAHNKNSGRAYYAGAAYIFARQGDRSWKEMQKLEASEPQTQEFFGQSVSLHGNYAMVGAINSRLGNYYTGAAYLFQRQGNSWREVRKLQDEEAKPNDRIGSSVSLHGRLGIVGAEYGDGERVNSGTAYVYQW